MAWPEDKKAAVAGALIPELTSSDEEGQEQLFQDTTTRYKKFWKVKGIPWESAKLGKRKQELDQHWLHHLATQKESRGQLSRVRGLVQSSRPRPDASKIKYPAWAVSQ